MKQALIALLFLFVPTLASLSWAQQKAMAPPSVYMHPFGSCGYDKPCAVTDNFLLAHIPPGCCVLSVANGDGKGGGEVRSYEVFLNDQLVVASTKEQYRRADVKLRSTNKLKVVLSGEVGTMVWIFLEYDPRRDSSK